MRNTRPTTTPSLSTRQHLPGQISSDGSNTCACPFSTRVRAHSAAVVWGVKLHRTSQLLHAKALLGRCFYLAAVVFSVRWEANLTLNVFSFPRADVSFPRADGLTDYRLGYSSKHNGGGGTLGQWKEALFSVEAENEAFGHVAVTNGNGNSDWLCSMSAVIQASDRLF